jgi:hypothetical protein
MFKKKFNPGYLAQHYSAFEASNLKNIDFFGIIPPRLLKIF